MPQTGAWLVPDWIAKGEENPGLAGVQKRQSPDGIYFASGETIVACLT